VKRTLSGQNSILVGVAIAFVTGIALTLVGLLGTRAGWTVFSAVVMLIIIGWNISKDFVREPTAIFLSIKSFFLIGFALFYPVSMLKQVLIYDAPLVYSASAEQRAILAIFAALGAFLIGSAFGRMRFSLYHRTHFDRPVVEQKYSSNRILLCMLAYLAFTVFGWINYYNPLRITDHSERNFGSEATVYLPVANAILATIWCFQGLSNRKKSQTAARVAFCIPILAVGLVQFNRATVMHLVSLWLVVFLYTNYYFRKDRSILRPIALVAFAAPFLYLLANLYKAVSLSEWRTLGLLDIPSILNDALTRSQVLDFLDTFENLTAVIGLYVDRHIYLWGWSLLNPIVNFIPRSFWAGKPEAFGVTLMTDLYGYNAYIGGSLAPSLLGESIANLGYTGAVIIFFCLGVLLRKLHEKFVRIRQPFAFYHIFYLLLLHPAFLQNRGDVLLNFSFGCIIAPVLFAFWFSQLPMTMSGVPSNRSWRLRFGSQHKRWQES